jgi:hypothetical protein
VAENVNIQVDRKLVQNVSKLLLISSSKRTKSKVSWRKPLYWKHNKISLVLYLEIIIVRKAGKDDEYLN